MPRVTSAALPACIVIPTLSSAPAPDPAAPAATGALLILLTHRRLRRGRLWTGSVIGAARVGALAVARALFRGWRRLKWNGGRWRRLWRRTYAVGVPIAPRVFVLF